MVFYIDKAKIKIEYSFLLILSFSLLFKGENLIYILLFSALHEMGHIAILLLLKGRIDCLTVSFYGIGLKHQSNFTDSQEVLFLLGGILVNMFFCIINIHREINLPLLIINALPLYPLDGGRVLKIVLNNIFALDVSDKIFKMLSALILISIFIFAVYVKNLSLFLIAVYIVIYSLNEVYR